MKSLKTSAEVDTAFNVLIKELGVEYYELDAETITNLNLAIMNDVKVKNSALLYLVCSSERAQTMRERLVRDVMELYERGN
jgi:hypothetical protein